MIAHAAKCDEPTAAKVHPQQNTSGFCLTAAQLSAILRDVICAALYQSADITADDIATLLPDATDDALRAGLAQVGSQLKICASLAHIVTQSILGQLDTWRSASIQTKIGLPALVDFDWQVDVKTASEAMSEMCIPTVLVDMKVSEPPSHSATMPSTRDIAFELSKGKSGHKSPHSRAQHVPLS